MLVFFVEEDGGSGEVLDGFGGADVVPVAVGEKDEIDVGGVYACFLDAFLEAFDAVWVPAIDNDGIITVV